MALLQVAVGVAVGCVMMRSLIAVAVRDADVRDGTVTSPDALLLVYEATMMGVCALPCIRPLLWVFRVVPTDVSRDDGSWRP